MSTAQFISILDLLIERHPTFLQLLPHYSKISHAQLQGDPGFTAARASSVKPRMQSTLAASSFLSARVYKYLLRMLHPHSALLVLRCVVNIYEEEGEWNIDLRENRPS